MPPHPQPKRLVIGIGNCLRGDDGVGVLLAKQAGGRSVQQLTPELAAELAQLDAVLFIDAWPAAAASTPQLIPVNPAASAAGSRPDSHRLEPAALLAVSQALYGRAPRGQLLLVPAYAFAHGTALSAALRSALPQARALLQQWLAGDA